MLSVCGFWNTLDSKKQWLIQAVTPFLQAEAECDP